MQQGARSVSLASLATLLQASYIVLLQVGAMVALSVSEFAVFSAAYLTYSLALSLMYSLVLDPLVVSRPRPAHGEIARVVIVIAGLGGLLAFVVMVLFGSRIGHAILGCLAVGLFLVRSAFRYVDVSNSRWLSLVKRDGAALCAMAVTWLSVEWLGSDALIAFLASWTASAGVSILGVRMALRQAPPIRNWLKTHREKIRPLLADTLFMDISSVGIPYALMPLLGVSGFGVYRAVANTSFPIRLLASPLRPLITRVPTSARMAVGLLASVCILAICAGLIAQAFLELFAPAFVGTVIRELSEYATATSLYIVGSVLVTFFSVASRGWATHRALLLGRGVHTTLGIVGPLGGWLVGFLGGAILGFAVATLVSGLVWMWVAYDGAVWKLRSRAFPEGRSL